MSPEDVPADLVEKAARALSDAIIDGSAEMAEDAAMVVLAAVLPEIQSQALRDAAAVIPHEMTWAELFESIPPAVRRGASTLRRPPDRDDRGSDDVTEGNES